MVILGGVRFLMSEVPLYSRFQWRGARGGGRESGAVASRGGLVFKAHILLYHPTLGSRVIKKKQKHHEKSLQRAERRSGRCPTHSLLLTAPIAFVALLITTQLPSLSLSLSLSLSFFQPLSISLSLSLSLALPTSISLPLGEARPLHSAGDRCLIDLAVTSN